MRAKTAHNQSGRADPWPNENLRPGRHRIRSPVAKIGCVHTGGWEIMAMVVWLTEPGGSRYPAKP